MNASRDVSVGIDCIKRLVWKQCINAGLKKWKKDESVRNAYAVVSEANTFDDVAVRIASKNVSI
jgi:hypothetical protein